MAGIGTRNNKGALQWPKGVPERTAKLSPPAPGCQRASEFGVRTPLVGASCGFGGVSANVRPPRDRTVPRRGAGVVERGGLENRCTFAGTVGSNPTPSATNFLFLLYFPKRSPTARSTSPTFRVPLLGCP